VTIRFAVVGCGTAANHIHLPLLRAAGADVTVFASRSRSSAESTCERLAERPPDVELVGDLPVRGRDRTLRVWALTGTSPAAAAQPGPT